jgi:imidazolonepropionase-like amidohydrolase
MRIVDAERRAGVAILAGTDYPNAMLAPGGSLIEEMIALRESGLSSADALRAATLTAGRAIGDSTSGLIRAGARADLVLVGGNPLDDLHALSRVDAVVLNGRWLSRAALVSIAPLPAAAPSCPGSAPRRAGLTDADTGQ